MLELLYYYLNYAGVLSLTDLKILVNMNRTQNQDEYDVFILQMSISAAHELTHLLTNFLTGNGDVSTPPTSHVNGMPVGSGEAGRYWEV